MKQLIQFNLSTLLIVMLGFAAGAAGWRYGRECLGSESESLLVPSPSGVVVLLLCFGVPTVLAISVFRFTTPEQRPQLWSPKVVLFVRSVTLLAFVAWNTIYGAFAAFMLLWRPD